ncbi:phytanoyl-CoA dioxygenase family protein [Sphingobium phenoxybenzoativorans]|uniref:Phytanoyl-CoA dioxygenase family protein n=1 Tax=Sphingobium phenoxybenzoativorans TaxID=1592790 RepID=A0A975K3X6_9SPHN|nr:phytanoyl-CoA dioxygenase family protein [Sphingobium phenoxybenzoativorans]QUT04386.1 phytanoyl-CoA dioxygenase family protein [Sphingobium phenoxybenzoativorans]
MNSHRHPILQLPSKQGVAVARSGHEVGLGTEILSVLRTVLGLPLWAIQIVSGTKSFADNPVIGSKRLNRLGLHAGRVRVAHLLARWRRSRLGRHVPAVYRAEFAANGFIRIDDYLPADEFAALRDAVLSTRAPAREMLQGDTITRRIAIDPEYLESVPQLRALTSASRWRSLVRYVASSASEPLYYIQTILTHRAKADPDPQTTFHADTFHPTMKAWYFLEDVAEDAGAFRYVPGSHKLTAERLAWEQARSIAAPEGVDRLSARGSMRILESELAGLKLPEPKTLGVKANTLVIADTFGFHARGHASKPTRRVEIWAYSRRNPFYPWTGFDPLSLRGMAERRIPWIWAAKDRFPKLFGAPWHDAGPKVPGSE